LDLYRVRTSRDNHEIDTFTCLYFCDQAAIAKIDRIYVQTVTGITEVPPDPDPYPHA